MAFLTPSFFHRGVLEVARDLIGVELVWQGCGGFIVETEAYAVEGDPACHTASRPSAREYVKVHPAGAAYVYMNYGVHWLFNLHVKGGLQDGLILVRALEPQRGVAKMRLRRGREKLTDLCSGPGKLAQALGITGEHHGVLLCGTGRPAGCGLKAGQQVREVVTSTRIGISQAQDFPWRFVAVGSPHVSVRA